MYKIGYNFLLLVILTFISSQPCYSQEITDAKVKSGFLYKFLEYIKWENEDRIDTFKVGVYGGDEVLFSCVKSLEQLPIKDKYIQVKAFLRISQITPCQLLMVSYESGDEVVKIFDRIKGTQTLLVSDRCDFKRSFMINFIHTEEGKIEFEINPKNMADENLYTSPNLLLIGGKEIDVRKLYLQTEKSLQNEKERAEGFEQELAIRQKEITLQNTKLKLLNDEVKKQNNIIDSQNINILNQKKILNLLQQQIVEQEKILAQKAYLNKKLAQEIEDNENDLRVKDSELRQKDSNLLTMKNTIEEYTTLQGELKTRINKQLEKIQVQQLVLSLVLAILALTITLGFLVYRNYRIKKEANIILEKLSIVASETDNAVMIMDASGKFEWLNEGFTRMYGYKLDEFIKSKGDNILVASSNRDIKEIFNTCIRTKKSVIYETNSTSLNGTKIAVQTTLTPILDKNAKITRLVAIDANITDIKYAEEKIIQKNLKIQKQADVLTEQAHSLSKANIILEEQKEKLQETLLELKNTQTQLVESEKMASLGILTAGIAHEINNPVNFINAGIDGLTVTLEDLMTVIKKYDRINSKNAEQVLAKIHDLKKKVDYEELKKGLNILLKNIKTGALRATEIVKSLKTFSRLDEGDLKFSDIHENIESTLVMLRNLYKGKVEIIKEYGNLPKIECYPGKINQVLMNIILNALQSIDEKGTITIRTRMHPEKDKTVIIEIEDTGHGMSEDVKSHIFEPFFTTKEIGKGTGLGLSITYSIIEKHRGKIEAESEIGKGSKFVVYLPIRREDIVA